MKKTRYIVVNTVRKSIPEDKQKKQTGNVVFTDHVPVIYLKILWQYMSRT